MREIFSIFCMLCLAMVMALAVTANAEIYKYVDKNGITHYTDNTATIPLKYRQNLEQYHETQITPLRKEKITPAAPSVQPATEAAQPAPSPADMTDTTKTTTIEPKQVQPVEPEPVVTPEKPAERKSAVKPAKQLLPQTSEPAPGGKSESRRPVAIQEKAPAPTVEKDAAKAKKAAKQAKEHAEKIRLLEKRKAIVGKTSRLDSEYQALLKERKSIETSRQNSESPKSIEKYNRSVKDLNEKITVYREKRKALGSEVEAFNGTLKK